MNSYGSKILTGTVSLGLALVSVSMFVFFRFPAEKDYSGSEIEAVSFLESNLSNNSDENFSLAVEFPQFLNEEDRALELYRQPYSRPAIEWFYTQITGSRNVALAILENADKNNIPLSLAFSLAYVESRYKPGAVNKNSNSTIDRGLFQLNSASFPKLTEEEFFDPQISAKYGMTHLRWCMDVAGSGNDITALAMYNAGTNRVKANKTPQQTLNYVAKISAYKAKLDEKFSNDILSFYSSAQKNSSLVKK